jgi:hypothetical protein
LARHERKIAADFFLFFGVSNSPDGPDKCELKTSMKSEQKTCLLVADSNP